jgi:meso-butanediol dehydrogenase / (S,S)-butanediol dehydrogenase / diacetyl reductase
VDRECALVTGATSGIGWATACALAKRGAVVGLLGRRRSRCPGYAAYCASKHGVIGLARTLALDHGPQGVRSNVICPGMVETPMSDEAMASYSEAERTFYRSNVPLGRFGKPHEVANAILHLTSDAASYSNGMVYSIDGGTTAGYYFAN